MNSVFLSIKSSIISKSILVNYAKIIKKSFNKQRIYIISILFLQEDKINRYLERNYNNKRKKLMNYKNK